MPVLDIWEFLVDPAKMTGAIVAGIGILGLLIIMALYPLSRDR
jgi:hypothetical protein